MIFVVMFEKKSIDMKVILQVLKCCPATGSKVPPKKNKSVRLQCEMALADENKIYEKKSSGVIPKIQPVPIPIKLAIVRTRRIRANESC